MRKTLHEYVLEQYNTSQENSIDRLANFSRCFRYAALTNCAPKLGDFIPCDENGNVLEEPLKDSGMTIVQFINSIGGIKAYNNHPIKELHTAYQAAKDRVIFKGEWEVISDKPWIVIREKELKIDIEFNDIQCDVVDWDDEWNTCDYFEITRIEDLPPEIEFKDNLI